MKNNTVNYFFLFAFILLITSCDSAPSSPPSDSPQVVNPLFTEPGNQVDTSLFPNQDQALLEFNRCARGQLDAETCRRTRTAIACTLFRPYCPSEAIVDGSLVRSLACHPVALEEAKVDYCEQARIANKFCIDETLASGRIDLNDEVREILGLPALDALQRQALGFASNSDFERKDYGELCRVARSR